MSDRHFFNGRLPGPRSRNGDRGAGAHLFGGHSQRLMTSRQVRQNIISLVGLIGCPVLNQSGEEVGRLVDLVAQVHGSSEAYPALTGIVVRVGRRKAYLDAAAIDKVERRSVTLRTARLDLREFQRREGEVLLHRDILDHQLVDTDEVQVIRAADLYLAQVGDQVRLVGVDVSLQTLLRRLGPKRFRWHPTPGRVIDWAAIESFGADSAESPSAVKLREPHSALRRLRPAELADVLEGLGRPGRRELLASLDHDLAADALEEMEPHELTALLREVEPGQAAELIARMEPDEAVDALRDLPADEQATMLAQMPAPTQRELARLLGYPGDEAGGVMTTVLACAKPEETVEQVRRRLAELARHQTEIDSVAVLDEDGRLIGDVSAFDLLVSDGDTTLAGLIDPDELPVTLRPDDDLDKVATEMVESRRSSLLVVDDEGRPLGRILSDDVLDALVPGHGRLHFPRLLQ
ncbi:MAG TPA: CBS domain-containing protein [Streptosporangiaceae bacterium]|nr:CBS domain-containing protein [Streptosporangiaceae bacterium]